MEEDQPLLSINLDVQSINYILDILSDKPYREVSWLIHELSTQANAQLKAIEDALPDEGKYVE